jgi:Na+-transporting NADH:ubiquinone oxidoreductase subunit NqrB
MVDARLYQIGFLGLFLALGLLTRDWTLHYSHILTAIAICLISQWVWLWALGRNSDDRVWQWADFYSPLITGLGLALLLRVDSPLVMAIAAIAAISSKFLLQIQGKHLFNPANFGIVFALLINHGSWVSPGQWGASIWLVALFLAAGGLVLQRVGRWDTSVAFLGFYAGLELLRHLYLGWLSWDVLAHRLMNGSLVMFALFMITDPRTIPNSLAGRLCWAFTIALLTFIFRNFFFINTAVFWALFIVSPLTVLWDRLFSGDRFVWDSKATA